MKHRFLDAIKDFIFIVMFTFILATLLNYINPDISFNKYWSKLGNLDWVNIYNSPNLNGLIVLGVILGVISFIYDMFFSNEKETDSN
ncbi:hypothetical protein [Staphylococcus equorum]|uniref:hypothetical protein n=1 Tax=Staphylococcus equorum TaxID=246432 RepID=UPI000D1D079A|nr:hypothetical protein [Staphylococcus equorum]PTE84545.1 hypothetical protein BUY90_10235 [Staphylococcus equorum]